MIKKLFGVAALTAFIFAAATPADARPPHAEKQIKASDIIWNDGKPQSATDRILDRVFTEAEKVIIEDYYKGRRGDRQTQQRGGGRGKGRTAGGPPGLAKRDSLPPGLAMQLERNGRLPPGLEKQGLSADLERRLPLREGLKRILAGDDVLLVDTATDIIVDILKGVAQQ
ncbi:MAG: hypothetical protein EA357_08055 [Micavibrio sp.]|nr:MAG: hypothetical protein EA357_08055 [Micavibrio sp.]